MTGTECLYDLKLVKVQMWHIEAEGQISSSFILSFLDRATEPLQCPLSWSGI